MSSRLTEWAEEMGDERREMEAGRGKQRGAHGLHPPEPNSKSIDDRRWSYASERTRAPLACESSARTSLHTSARGISNRPAGVARARGGPPGRTGCAPWRPAVSTGARVPARPMASVGRAVNCSASNMYGRAGTRAAEAFTWARGEPTDGSRSTRNVTHCSLSGN